MIEQLDLTKIRAFYEHDAYRSGRELAQGRLDIVFKELRKCLGYNIKRQRILDIGISDGYLLKQAIDLRAISYGIDIAFSMLQLAKKNIFTKGKRGCFIQCSVTHLPFLENSFNMITACEILEHLDAEGLMRALKEIFRVLVPGGYLFVTTPYNEQIANSYIKCPECGFIFSPHGHYCSFNEDKWKSLTADIGFSKIKIKKIYGTDFRLKKLNFCLPLIRLMVRLFSVDSLTRLLVIIRK